MNCVCDYWFFYKVRSMHFDYMFQYFLLLNNKFNNALVINSFIPKIFFLNILILVYIWLDYEARPWFNSKYSCLYIIRCGIYVNLGKFSDIFQAMRKTEIDWKLNTYIKMDASYTSFTFRYCTFGIEKKEQWKRLN